ncbi:MAG: nitrate reductase molybdenum cofactor assembly chaperone [Alphaproteobacteria bacterium]|nr:nitrate reductase molybdenum cofactor assembly chaperone [Alphaproteobacteria bacterium]
MRRSLKALAALLAYPERPLIDALPEIEDAVRLDRDLPVPVRGSLAGLIADLYGNDLIDAQERYVALFDRSRSLSLHLFEHVHGDSRERGPAMVDLLKLYNSHGLDIAEGELPDYLPTYLEYAAQLDRPAGVAALADVAHILAPIRDRLKKHQSPYAAVFDAALAMSGAAVVPYAADGDAEAVDDDFAALDRAWEEAAVTFGPENEPGKSGDCGRAQDILRRMNAS